MATLIEMEPADAARFVDDSLFETKGDVDGERDADYLANRLEPGRHGRRTRAGERRSDDSGRKPGSIPAPGRRYLGKTVRSVASKRVRQSTERAAREVLKAIVVPACILVALQYTRIRERCDVEVMRTGDLVLKLPGEPPLETDPARRMRGRNTGPAGS